MRLVTSFFLAITLTVSFVHAEVRVVGCDLLGKDFADGLNAYSRRNDLGIKLDLAGSEIGLEQLRLGTADLGIIFLSPQEKKPENSYVVITAAYQACVVVVPTSVPITQISFDQLNAIYADAADSSIKRWGDLGVTGGWENRGILPTITGPDGGLSYDLFRYTVMRTPSLKPIVAQQDSAEATLRRMLGDEGGIAIMALLPEKQRDLKVLAVARKSTDVAFGPTPENCPIRRLPDSHAGVFCVQEEFGQEAPVGASVFVERGGGSPLEGCAAHAADHSGAQPADL
jgi:hypothetical protein